MNISNFSEHCPLLNKWHHCHESHYKAGYLSLLDSACLTFTYLDIKQQVKRLSLQVHFAACALSLIQTDMKTESWVRQTFLDRSLVNT